MGEQAVEDGLANQLRSIGNEWGYQLET